MTPNEAPSTPQFGPAGPALAHTRDVGGVRRGRGLALEAAEASMDYAFDVLGWADVIHCIAPDNIPSQRLAMKLGSRNQGPTRLPPPYHEAAVDRWGQSRADWAVNRLKPPAERG